MIPMSSTTGTNAIRPRDSKVSRYEQDAGASPLFPPAGLDEELAEADIAHHVHRSPELFEIDRSTWTLSTIRSVTAWMSQVSLTTVQKYLHRFRLSYKRGRQHVHSPDPQYHQKMEAIALARDLALQAPSDVVFLYQDEHTANLRPVVGRSYGGRGDKGSKATGAASSLIRLAGVLDVATGQVLVRRRTTFPVKEMFRFFYHVEQHYPQAQVIYIALDNWPNHFHRYVLDNLKRINSKIRLLPLPTYAPWTNPIEKFWLKLNREFMRQHRYGREKLAFRDALDLWLDKHREESAALLHEVGLLPKGWKVLPD
jgi:transposase